jgi:hypothetical protein
MAYDNQGQRVLIAPLAPGAPQPGRSQSNAAPSWNTFELLMLSTESSSCGSTPKETARVMTSRGGATISRGRIGRRSKRPCTSLQCKARRFI